MRSLTRRDLLKLSVISGLATFAAACRASLTPTAAPDRPSGGGNTPKSTQTPKAADPTQSKTTPNPTASQMRADVIVIGAGMSGLAAASQLKESGYSVIILEGRERIGGRTWTDDSLSVPLDMGGSWIHGIKGNPISALADRFKVTRVPTDYDAVALYDFDGRPVSDTESDKIDQAFESMMKKVAFLQEDLDNDISLQAAIDRSTKSSRSMTYSINTTIEHEYAADVSDMSLFEWDQEDDEFPGGDVVFPKGYIQLVNGLADGLDIRTGTIVKKIDYQSETVRIETAKGEFRCEQVVVTLPLGVLKKGNVTFSPELPEKKRKAIARLKMGVLNKVYLRFPRVFWDDDAHVIGYMSEKKGQWCEWYNIHKYNGQPVLMGFNAAAYGTEIESQSDQQIVAGAMATLRRIYGDNIPAPEKWAITRWMSDPFSYGSYSYIPTGASGADYDELARPVAGRVFFAGEATYRKAPSTVHGAYLSGIRAAKEIDNL